MSVEIDELERQVWPELQSVPDLQPVDVMSRVDIIGIREGGLIDCWVPTDLIDHEEVPVKAHWVQSLATDMRAIAEKDGGSGQLAPILLGKIEGENYLKIIDGFHRDAALVQNGETKILATIKETDPDELYDIRIFTAKDHAHVRFSRVVQWIREVWSISGFEDLLTVEQAVLLYRFDSSGHNLGLSDDQALHVKEWITKKESQWQMAAMTIHSHLKVAENVDPLIVHATREKKSGHVLEAPTQAIIKIFSKEIPGNFVMQNYVMDLAKAHNLKGPQVKALCMTVKDFTTVEEADQVTQYIDWDKWQPKFGETKSRSLRRAYDPRYKGAAVLDIVSSQIDSITERVDQSLKLQEIIDPAMIDLIHETEQRIAALRNDLGVLSVKLSQLRKPLEQPNVEPPIVEIPVVEIPVEEPPIVEQPIAKIYALFPEPPVVEIPELLPEPPLPVTDIVPVKTEQSPADIVAEENRRLHESWGLKFTLYDDEVAPVVHWNGKARYDFDDTVSLLLQCIAERSPRDVLPTEQIVDLMIAKGHKFKEYDPGKEVRTAIREIISFFKKYGKDKHLIVRTGGHKQVIFGLAV